MFKLAGLMRETTWRMAEGWVAGIAGDGENRLSLPEGLLRYRSRLRFRLMSSILLCLAKISSV